MARRISQTLTTTTSAVSTTRNLLKLLPDCHRRNQLFSSKAQLIEVDLDDEQDQKLTGLTMKLEDAIHSIFVRRLAPEWLPLRPGSSYWVPPKRSSDNIVELVEKLTYPLSEDESLSLVSPRGWPSSSFFLDGSVPEHSAPMQVEVQVFVPGNVDKPAVTEDEE